jgi:hypothetical protein
LILLYSSYLEPSKIRIAARALLSRVMIHATEFRSSSLILIALAFFAADLRIAAAQTAPFQCFANGGVPATSRAESISELVGDLTVDCTGGTPTASGSPIPTVDIQVFLNTSISSKLLAGSWSEALLLVDEPAASSQRMCGTSGDTVSQAGVCTITGNGSGVGTYNGNAGRPNVFQGVLAATNALLWTGVPIDPPGNGNRTIRITNVRGNANALGVTGANATPTPIVETISPMPAGGLPVANPSQTVAFIQSGQTFALSAAPTLQQCNSQNAALAGDPTSSGVSQFSLRFAENTTTSFRRRNTATSAANPGALANQNNLIAGTYFAPSNTESGFYNSSFPAIPGQGNLGVAGLADQGTRLIARFSNVPAGVQLFSQVSGGPASIGPDVVRMISTDVNGNGPYSPVAANSFGIAPILVSNSMATAVYEVEQSDPTTFSTVDIPIYVAHISNVGSNLPGLNTVTVSASYSPLSVMTNASATESVPRFANTSYALNAFTTQFCSCATFTTSSASFGSAGGPGTFMVTAAGACGWNVVSNNAWITVLSPGFQTGSATVSYSVAPNSNISAQSGTISSVGGLTFTVNEAGVSCAYSPSPTATGFTSAGGGGSVNLTPNSSSCLWTATSDSSWLTITSELYGGASGVATYTVAANPNTTERSATLTVAGQTFTVTEAGTGSGAQPLSVSPALGSAGRQVFSFVSLNTLGANSIQYTQFLFSRSGISALNACYISYDPTANVFYLLSDDTMQWYGLLGGSGNNIGNGQCTIFGATSGATKSGTNLATSVDIGFRSGFAGAKSIYQFSGDTLGNGSGWQPMGTWSDAGDPNIVEIASLTPNSGGGLSQTFTAVVKEGGGGNTIAFAQFVMNAGLNGFNACFIHYDRASNVFYLLNDAGTGWFGLISGSATQVQNSQCILQGVGSGGTVAGSNLTITYNLSFTGSFTGARQIYMQAVDQAGIIEVWHQTAVWTP